MLVNFNKYLELFAQWNGVEIIGLDRPMPSLTVGGDITMIKFGMGSPNAAIIMDLLSAINLKLLFF